MTSDNHNRVNALQYREPALRPMRDAMRVGIIGSGISGLSAAFYLSKRADARITLYERSNVFGGRASVTSEGEHCARFFLDDYTYLFAILKEIIRSDGRSVQDSLRRVTRYCHTESFGWVEISHLYLMLAKEVSLQEKFRIAKARLTSPLVAEHNVDANTNQYGSLRNYSARSLVKMVVNLLTSKVAYTLDGPTDECLIHPWVDHLQRKGVTLKISASVEAIRSEGDGVSVYSEDTWQTFDSVIVTAFAPDVADLLTASGIEHSLKVLNHTHCKCLTLILHANEKILHSEHTALYCRHGINILLQPKGRRCVVLCTKSPSTQNDYVLTRVREILGLEYEIPNVTVRENQRPEEAVFAADYINSNTILKTKNPHVYFAGSYIKNSYPLDSGEGAARSACDVVRRLERDRSLSANARISESRRR